MSGLSGLINFKNISLSNEQIKVFDYKYEKLYKRGPDESKLVIKNSFHAKIDITAGSKFKESDFKFLRPGDGISPFEIEEFVGKELKTRIKKGDPILAHYIF